MIIKARKKPVMVEVMKFTDETKDQVYNFVKCTTSPDWESGEPVLRIQTLEGVMTARLGDYIIKGVNGEFYPCKPDIFHMTYDIVDNKDELIEEVILFIDNNTEYHFKIHVDADDFYGYIGIGISHDSLSSEEVFSEARGLNRLAVKEGIKATIYANT